MAIDITDYAQIVRYETIRIHLEQIKITIAFMVNYSSTYFIETKHSMRFVNTIDILNEQCLDDYVKYVVLTCTRNTISSQSSTN